MNKEINNKKIPMAEKTGAKKILKDNPAVHDDDRADKLKLYSIGSVVILIVIIILANVLFDKALGKALTFDFSDAGQNSISQASEDFIDSLPADTRIRIVGLFTRPDNVAGTPYQYIVPLLDDYVKKSDGKITVDYVNINEQPTIISQLDPANAYDLSSKSDTYVVEYNGKIKIVDPINCYTYDESLSQYYGKYVVIGNNTEFTFTNAMFVLTNNSAFKAYIVTGLKEDGNAGITKILDSMAIDVQELPVSETFAVPDDCDLLILNGPNNDISEKVYVAMSDYLKKGGKMFIAVNYSLDNVSVRFDRLNALLNQVNINIDPALISENDPGYQLSGSAIDSTVTAAELFNNYANIPYLHSTYARSVRKIDSSNSGIKTYPVLCTSKKATLFEVDSQGNIMDTGSSAEGQYNVAMYSVGSGDDPSKVFVFGTLNFSSDEYIASYGLNDINMDFFRSCIRELSSSKTVTALSISTKNVDNFSLASDKSTTSHSTAVLIVFLIVIPVLLIAAAVIVYSKRKNL
ncbi:MAG: Gldg family protein [Clostridiales bacterium]|nr:Gldg family protein [Clostridiales bacterium]